MTDATAVKNDTTEEELELDLNEESSNQQFSGLKKIYRTNLTNTFQFTEDGEVQDGYIEFKGARLISVSARVQETQGGKALVMQMGIVLDDPEVGRFDGDVREPHPLHTLKRYRKWQNSNRAKRVNAQQWVQAHNTDKVKELVNYLRNNHQFQVIPHPKPREDQQRTTRDLFVARPRNDASNHVNEYGAKLDGFEVSINPAYIAKGPGFSDFYSGLNDQQERWEGAYKIDKPEQRQQQLDQIKRNIHFVGGVYRDQDQRRWWARPVDVGMLLLDDKAFPLYERQGEELTDDIFSELAKESDSQGTGNAPSLDELDF